MMEDGKGCLTGLYLVNRDYYNALKRSEYTNGAPCPKRGGIRSGAPRDVQQREG